MDPVWKRSDPPKRTEPCHRCASLQAEIDRLKRQPLGLRTLLGHDRLELKEKD